MGHAPPRRSHRLPTRLDVARTRYIRGALELDEFERQVEELLANDAADNPAPMSIHHSGPTNARSALVVGGSPSPPRIEPLPQSIFFMERR